MKKHLTPHEVVQFTSLYGYLNLPFATAARIMGYSAAKLRSRLSPTQLQDFEALTIRGREEMSFALRRCTHLATTIIRGESFDDWSERCIKAIRAAAKRGNLSAITVEQIVTASRSDFVQLIDAEIAHVLSV